LSPNGKTWHLVAHDLAPIARLGEALGIPPIVAQLLCNRGLGDQESARRFLKTPFGDLHEPAMLPGVAEAADRLFAAVHQGKRVCVYGDYDVDGLTGTAILWQTLRALGAPTDYYVPHRLEEGYGVNREALVQIARAGTSVVVTVDCGITSIAEAEDARRLGLERLPGTCYPFGGLSGSGVAFKLAWALCQRASGATKVTPQFREFLLDSVALAALGMVADWVPLHDENRIIVRHGLARLARTTSPGLLALLEAAGLKGKSVLKASDISFSLAPRLNAAGRLGCARLVIDLLTTTSQSRALEVARFLEKQNEERQQIERRILAEAREMLAGCDLEGTPAFVLASPDWHAGVIGIVAGRLVERFARPVFLIALRDEPAVSLGSGRSVPGLALHEALSACGEGLISHGGHAAAAGLKIHRGRVPDFRDRFCSYVSRNFVSTPAGSRLVIDAEVPLTVLTPALVESLTRLEPYGAGNPRPLFLAGPLHVLGEPRRVGKGERHLRFRVRQEPQGSFPAIAFNLADRVNDLMSAGGQCCLVFSPTFNEWQGWRSLQLEVVDFQPGTRARLG
jgi:single-stranded-DNA-specific exonuclease